MKLAVMVAVAGGLRTGIFDAIEGALHITFGTTARRGTFITVWRT